MLLYLSFLFSCFIITVNHMKLISLLFYAFVNTILVFIGAGGITVTLEPIFYVLLK